MISVRRALWGAFASWGAVLQGGFITLHPQAILQHPADLLGAQIAMVLTTVCVWQYKHDGLALNLVLQARQKRQKQLQEHREEDWRMPWEVERPEKVVEFTENEVGVMVLLLASRSGVLLDDRFLSDEERAVILKAKAATVLRTLGKALPDGSQEYRASARFSIVGWNRG
jgi:hypothetical protein